MYLTTKVCVEENCEEGTFHLSCCYLDRMVNYPYQIVHKSNLQKFASVAMLIACKFKQSQFITPSLLYQYTDLSISSCDIKVNIFIGLNICKCLTKIDKIKKIINFNENDHH